MTVVTFRVFEFYFKSYFFKQFFSRIINSIAASPLLQVPGGTKKTERRRSRSRSRQEIESELARKVNEIPMVHDTIEYLLSTYSLIKVFNQITT